MYYAVYLKMYDPVLVRLYVFPPPFFDQPRSPFYSQFLSPRNIFYYFDHVLHVFVYVSIFYIPLFYFLSITPFSSLVFLYYVRIVCYPSTVIFICIYSMLHIPFLVYIRNLDELPVYYSNFRLFSPFLLVSEHRSI